MSEAITVFCPSCKASLKLKSRSAVGKRVPCPKCKKPFVVKPPAEVEDDEMAFLNTSESDGAMEMPDEDETEAAAAQVSESTGRGSGSRKKKRGKGKKAAPVNWLKPLLIGVASLAFVGLLVGGGMFAVSFIGGMSKNKIDLTYLPPDAELLVHARVDEMLASPFMQPVVATPAFKQSLDKLTDEYHVPLGDIKSVTVGLTGISDGQLAKLMPMSAMGIPGGTAPGQGMPGSPNGFSNVRRVIVIRTLKPLPADLMAKIPGYETATHQGTTYYRPGAASIPASKLALYLAAPDVLLVADEGEIQRIVEKGSKQTRRSEFDFIETSPQLVIAMINKSSATTGAPAAGGPAAATPGTGMPGGMAGGPPGGMPGAGMTPGAGGATGLAGLANLPSLANGKVKAWYVGISFTQDIEIQTGLHCPDSAKDALADVDRELTKEKNEFASKKSQLGMLAMFGLGDLIPHIETTVNSLSVTGTDSVVQVNAKIPGAVASTIEKAAPTLMGLAGGGPGGNPFGGPAPADGAPEGNPEEPAADAASAAGSQNPARSP